MSWPRDAQTPEWESGKDSQGGEAGEGGLAGEDGATGEAAVEHASYGPTGGPHAPQDHG